jgi:hypothetical protein
MLLRFGVQNFLSIRDYAEVSFAAAAYKDRQHKVFRLSGGRYRVLPMMEQTRRARVTFY